MERLAKIVNSIVWRSNRLRLMNVSEAAFRVRRSIKSHLELFGLGLIRKVPEAKCFYCSSPWIDAPPSGLDNTIYLYEADRILAGYFDIFALKGVHVGFPPQWNRDPKSGVTAPLINGKFINYRDERVVGNIKYLWEMNRHLQVTSLAQAYRLSGDARYAHGLATLLDSWFEQCPYPLGPNWASSLELAIRLVNWSFSWNLIGGDSSPLFISAAGEGLKEKWLANIYRHCKFITRNLSLHSSANNHLFGELSGLYIAASTWPYWQENDQWLNLSVAGLEREAICQISRDGVTREQAIYYHHAVADMMVACYVIGKANRRYFSKRFMVTLEKMLEFIMSVMDVAGNVPMIGDADDAFLVKWDIKQSQYLYKSILATGAVIFSRSDFKTKAGSFDEKSRWLLGDKGACDFISLPLIGSTNNIRREFRDGGYFILGNNFGAPNEVRIVADTGKLGYLSIAAHGHADALAFTLSVNGKPLLIDPGTYSYHTEKRWRCYFRGTSAHNTVEVDGMDQSVSGGAFMWLQKAEAHCESWFSNESEDCLVGSHNGYLRLKDPLVHRRKIMYLKNKSIIVVEDVLECLSKHEVCLYWHFHEQCDVRLESNKVKVDCQGVGLEVSMMGGVGVPKIYVGDDVALLGWVSRGFDSKVPSPSVVWRETINGGTKFTTIFKIESHQL